MEVFRHVSTSAVVDALAFLEQQSLEYTGRLDAVDSKEEQEEIREAVSLLLDVLAVKLEVYQSGKSESLVRRENARIRRAEQHCGRCGKKGHKRTTCPEEGSDGEVR